VCFPAAVATAWILNRSFTFRRDAPPVIAHPAAEWVSYLGLMLLGGAVNYGVYAFAIAASATVRAHPELGIALGAIPGMGLNFWSAKRVIYGRTPAKPKP